MHHEFYHLAKKISQNQSQQKQALVTVVHVQGSAYRREGTRMLVNENGNWFGNISGGCLEGDILQKTKTAIESGKNLLVTYDTRQSANKEIRVALGCNGIIDILIEPINATHIKLSQKIAFLFETEQIGFLTTQIELNGADNHVIYRLTKNQPANFSSEVLIRENYCEVDKTNKSIVIHEYIGKQRKIIIWGSGPDVVPVANFANQLGWKVVVASDCGIENLRNQLPETKIYQSNFTDFVQLTRPHENTAVLLVSHDFFNDYFILEKITNTPVKYIGIMGPKRRGARMIDELKKRHPNRHFDSNNLYYPVGLDIGSDNPTEIALSIIAEIQSVFSDKNGKPLSHKKNRIHDTISGELTEEFNPTNSVCTIQNL